ncbi:MAG: hypothetical protein ABEK59_08375 [Halobacteria archaeon]
MTRKNRIHGKTEELSFREKSALTAERNFGMILAFITGFTLAGLLVPVTIESGKMGAIAAGVIVFAAVVITDVAYLDHRGTSEAEARLSERSGGERL